MRRMPAAIAVLFTFSTAPNAAEHMAGVPVSDLSHIMGLHLELATISSWRRITAYSQSTPPARHN